MRARLARTIDFYRSAPCRMARVHVLTSCMVVLGRFASVSRAVDEIGGAVAPLDARGRPRSRAWRRYADACRAGRPFEVRDELWIEAHVRDIEEIRRRGLVAALEVETQGHGPTVRLLRQHVAFTLGAQLVDDYVLAGALPLETAMARSLARGVLRLLTAGWLLLAFYGLATVRALGGAGPRVPNGVASDRRAALELLRSALLAWTAVFVFRRGIRARERGREVVSDGWPLLAQVLGERTREVDPVVVDFYRNPARFSVTASLDLDGWLARFVSRVLTHLSGQGLYEGDGREVDARFRVFRRDDGSMHFVRELYVRDVLRVFDSDFVVREVEGRPTLVEAFVELGVHVEMDVRPLPGGGLSIRGRRVVVHGVPVPLLGLVVDFQSRPLGRSGEVAIDGHLFFRERELGCIHYRARRARPFRAPRRSPLGRRRRSPTELPSIRSWSSGEGAGAA
jgi:hypothetical protein